MKIKVVVSVVLVLIAALILNFYNPFASEEAGEIRIIVINEGETIIDQWHDFYESDSLYTVLDRNYTIETSTAYSQAFGRHLLAIESAVTDFENTFIHIAKDGEHVHLGIDYLPLKDGSEYTFEVKIPQ